MTAPAEIVERLVKAGKAPELPDKGCVDVVRALGGDVRDQVATEWCLYVERVDGRTTVVALYNTVKGFVWTVMGVSRIKTMLKSLGVGREVVEVDGWWLFRGSRGWDVYMDFTGRALLAALYLYGCLGDEAAPGIVARYLRSLPVAGQMWLFNGLVRVIDAARPARETRYGRLSDTRPVPLTGRVCEPARCLYEWIKAVLGAEAALSL